MDSIFVGNTGFCISTYINRLRGLVTRAYSRLNRRGSNVLGRM